MVALVQSNRVPSHFTADMVRLTTALAPWATEHGIRPGAPESLTRPYRSLVSMGYAKGWL